MAGLKLAEIYIDINARLGGLYSSINKARAIVYKFGNEMVASGRSMMLAGALISAPFIKATKAAADFQKQMAYVSTMLIDTTMHLLPKMSSGIKDMSIEFGRSTKELTDGLYMLLSAQVPAAEAMEYLRVASISAVGGMTTVENAVLGLTKMMKAYGDQLEDVGDAADFLFSVTRQGQGTFGEFVMSIPRVSGVAAIAGLRLEEMGASVANTSRLLENARRSTFALSSMFMVFGKATDSGKKAARELGFELSTVSLRGMGLVGVLNKLGKATPEQIAEIFPRRAVRAVSALLQKPEEYLADLWVMFTRSGRSLEAFQKVADTANFEFSQLGKTFNVLAIEAGGHLLPIVRKIGVAIKDLGPGMRDWIVANGALVKGLAAAAVAIVAIGAALFVAGKALELMVTALTIGPWAIIAAGAAMALMAFTDMGDGFEDFVNNISIGGHKIKTWMTGVALELMKTWTKVWSDFGIGWDHLVTSMRSGWNDFIASVRAGLQIIDNWRKKQEISKPKEEEHAFHRRKMEEIRMEYPEGPLRMAAQDKEYWEHKRRLETINWRAKGKEEDQEREHQANLVAIEEDAAAKSKELREGQSGRDAASIKELANKLKVLSDASIALWDRSVAEGEDGDVFDKLVQAYRDAKKLWDELFGNTGGSIESLASQLGTLFTSPWMQAPEGAFSTTSAIDPALDYARKTAENTDQINKKLPAVAGLGPN